MEPRVWKPCVFVIWDDVKEKPEKIIFSLRRIYLLDPQKSLFQNQHNLEVRWEESSGGET